MSDANVRKACTSAGMVTPCYRKRYSNSECTLVGDDVWILDDLSDKFCGQDSVYRNCPQLESVFVHQGNNYKGGSAYGAIDGSYVDGKDVQNKWALCMKFN
jgi:hypothetical protein